MRDEYLKKVSNQVEYSCVVPINYLHDSSNTMRKDVQPFCDIPKSASNDIRVGDNFEHLVQGQSFESIVLSNQYS